MYRRLAMERLKSTGWLSRQTAAFQDALLKNCDLRTYEAGATIQIVGDDFGGLYGLAKGEMTVLIAPEDRPPVITMIAQPGWWFGDVALINERLRVVTLVARSPVEIICVDRVVIRELVESDNDGWRRIAQITVGHLEEALRIIAGLSEVSPDIRASLAFLRLLARSDIPPCEPATFRISQEELGEMTRMTRNAIKPVLKRMESEGLISWGYRSMSISSENDLRSYIQRRASETQQF